ncbi:MAG: DUF4912 domain-containing protein [Nitrospinales bacterium]
MSRNKNSKTSSEKNSRTQNIIDIEATKTAEIRNPKKPESEVKKPTINFQKKSSPEKAINQIKKNTGVKTIERNKSSAKSQDITSKEQSLQTEVPTENEGRNQTDTLKQEDENLLQDSFDLPNSYCDHRLVLIARDPKYAFCFWEIDDEKVKQHFDGLGKQYQLNHWNLRIYCNMAGNIEKGKLFSDSEIDLSPGKIYLELFPPGSTFTAELGVMDNKNNYYRILTSNSINLPPDSPSENHEVIWTKGEDIQEAFMQSAESQIEKPELFFNRGPMQSFGESSSSRYKGTKQ